MLSFAAVRHYVSAFAVRVQSGSATMVYSGDSAPCDALTRLARGCDLFLCEASLGDEEEREPRGHSSAREAGETARAANVASLALTHYPAEYAAEMLREEAASVYNGPITVVDDGMDIAIARG
jgi:ribonuclease BN (tRNA processing enzyme)